MTDLAYLLDYLAICDVKARYCRCLDTKDWEGYGNVFTDDVELDTRPAGGIVTYGRDEALKTVRRSVQTARTAHQVHSPEITIEGDTAQVIWAMQDRVVWGPDRNFEPGLTGHTGYGHYTERYVRQNGQWRIAASRLSRLHVDNHYK